MVRPTDGETIDIEEVICYRFQKEGAGYAMQDHMGKHQGGQQAEASRGKRGQESSVVSTGKNR